MAKIFISWNVVSTSKVILVVREKSSPLSEVFRSPVYNPPHVIRNLTVIDLNPVMHEVQIWTTVDGVILLALKGQCDIDASLGTDSSVDIVTFIVDRGILGAPNYDPVTPTNQYVNPNLDGKTYVVFKPGFGPLQFGTHIQTIPGGGFMFIDGQVFSSGEEYTILVSNLIQTTSQPSGKSYPEDLINLNADLTLGTTHYNKMFLAIGAGPIITITIADINLVPNNIKFGINSEAGSCKYVVIQLPSGAVCKVRGISRNKLYVAKGETVNFQKKDGALHVINWNGDVHRIGDRLHKDALAPINSVAEVGAWYLKTDEPRLWDWYAAELPGGEVDVVLDDTVPPVVVSHWAATTLKFWVPDTGGQFERNYDPNSDVDTSARVISGSPQGDLVKTHIHGVPIGNGASGTPMPDYNPIDGNIQRAVAFTGSGITDSDDLTMRTGLENRPKNIMKRVYIIT